LATQKFQVVDCGTPGAFDVVEKLFFDFNGITQVTLFQSHSFVSLVIFIVERLHHTTFNQ
jgi:hypothetical protein